MPGMSDVAANNLLAGVTARPFTIAWPTNLYMGLFTNYGADSGTGFTEIVGNNYARVQVAGRLTVSSGQGSPGTILTFTSVPSWVVPNMTLVDVTNPSFIPTTVLINGTTSTTITINPASTTAVPANDVIQITAFQNLPTGGEPAVLQNNAPITFNTPSGNWGTVIGWGLFDQPTGGNLWAWDFLGGFLWLPCYISFASPAQWNIQGHGYSANDTIIFSNEVIQNAHNPTFSAGSFSFIGDGGPIGVSPQSTVNSVLSPDVITVANGATVMNTSASGSGMVRKISPAVINSGASVSFTNFAITFLGA